jgi:hypothetical protein
MTICATTYCAYDERRFMATATAVARRGATVYGPYYGPSECSADAVAVPI